MAVCSVMAIKHFLCPYCVLNVMFFPNHYLQNSDALGTAVFMIADLNEKQQERRSVSSDSLRKGTSKGLYYKDDAEAEDKYSCFSLHIHFPGINLKSFSLKAVGNSLWRLSDVVLIDDVL